MQVKAHNQKAFTLIEVIAATILLGLLLSGAYSVLHQSTSQVLRSTIAQRATEVARRQMELLITTRQEPETTGLENIDEEDPDFSWTIEAKRETPCDKTIDLKNSVIHITITVKYLGDGNFMEPYQLHRFFEYLEPKPGNTIAVPLQNAYENDPLFRELLEKYGGNMSSEQLKNEMLDVEK